VPTGEVELCQRNRGWGRPELPPPVFGEQEYPEDIRLNTVSSTFAARCTKTSRPRRIVDAMRKRMKDQGFFEFQTRS
jgi:aspartyl-tRNA synthetase